MNNKFIFCLVFLFFPTFAFALPWVIAHRGGGQNFPENTLLAFTKAIEIGVDAIELDVQVTEDGVVAVYHPEKLEQWTNGSGTISSHTWSSIEQLDAGYRYKPEMGYPFRGQGLHIPSLNQVLNAFPDKFLIIDLKSLPAERLVKALIQTISDKESSRLIFYSTNSEHIELLNLHKPHWITFEKRDSTRQRLLDLNQTQQTNLPITSHWIGFELKRKMVVTETFALGHSTGSVEFHLWDPQTISYLRYADPNAFLVLFGINTLQDWEEAQKLDVDAVYTDDPRLIQGSL